MVCLMCLHCARLKPIPDLELLSQHVRYGRKIISHEPLKSALVRELEPGSEVTSDAPIRGKHQDAPPCVKHVSHQTQTDYIKKTMMSGFRKHVISYSMCSPDEMILI
jgi:hypothetical protein